MSAQNLIDRSVSSVKWNVINRILSSGFGFFQTIILARILPVNTFGVYETAVAMIALTRIVSNFGLGPAFWHRSPETEDIERAAANHFSINSIFSIIWALLMIAGGLVFFKQAQSDIKLAYYILILSDLIVQILNTPRVVLVRKVQHERLAVLSMSTTILTAFVSISMALLGFKIWALLVKNIINALLNILLMALWRPVWKIRFAWNPNVIRYYMHFGSRSFLARLILEALDRVDDLWTSIFLGTQALGFYSRAYRFAIQPRILISEPVYLVAGGVYAELKNDRERLSEAFMRINSLMIRSGFLIGGALFIVAPEFICVALGEKWLPMLDVFRLMLIFTLFDPIKQTLANLFTALGKPEIIVRIRVVQLLVMIGGLFGLGLLFDISGVAIAVDIMLIVGVLLLMWMAKKNIDFSLDKLLRIPVIAMSAGIFISFLISTLIRTESDLFLGFIKILFYMGVYGTILFVWDRQEVKALFNILKNHTVKYWHP